jgi:tRNA 2-thiouridine synthesizing protein A
MKTLDITGDQCPMTFVKTKVALHDLSKGELMEVFLCDGEPLKNVPRAIQESGHRVVSVEQAEGGVYRVIIEK